MRNVCHARDYCNVLVYMFVNDAWWSSTFIINAFWTICELPDYSIENEHNNSCLKCWRSQFLSACCNIWKIWTPLDCRGANSELIHIFELVSEKDRKNHLPLKTPSDWNVDHPVWACLSSWFYDILWMSLLNQNLIFIPTGGSTSEMLYSPSILKGWQAGGSGDSRDRLAWCWDLMIVCGVPDLNRNKTKAVTNSWWKMFFSLGATSCADGVNRLGVLAEVAE